MGAFIGQVAHTLPVPLVGSANRPDDLTFHGLLPSGYEGPTGIVGVLNHALGNAGIDVISVWAAVPHYLSNQEYPPAAEALAIKASELVGITLDIDELAAASRNFLSTVDAAIEGNAELEEYVERLEQEADDDDEGDHLVDEIERLPEGPVGRVHEERTGNPGPFTKSLPLVAIRLQTLAVLVLRHLLTTLFDQRSHAETSRGRGTTTQWSRDPATRSNRSSLDQPDQTSDRSNPTVIPSLSACHEAWMMF